jgi:hypothetical protein
MMGRRRALFPEVDLAIDDDHWCFLFRNVAKCSCKVRPNASSNNLAAGDRIRSGRHAGDFVRVLQVRLAPVG